MGALDISIVGPALPEISRSVHMEREALSWVFSIYVLFNLIGLPLLARLSDVYGRKYLYVISVAIFGVGSIIVSLSHGYEMLLFGRAIQGFGSSGIFPVASAVIGDVYPPEKRGRALGMIGAVFGLAFLIGPILAGFVLKYFTWHVLFSINVPIAVILIAGAVRFLPSKKGGSMKNFDWRGVILLGAFVASFALALTSTDHNHFFDSLVSTPVIWFLLTAMSSFFLLIYFEKSAKSPILNLDLFNRMQVRVVGIIAVATGIFQASFVFVPDFTVKAFGVPASKASFMLLPVVLATAVGSPLAGRLVDKFGSRFVVLIGLVFAGSGVFQMTFVGHSVSHFYIAGIFVGLGLSMLAGPALRYIILNEVSASERALTQGILTMFISLGQISGSAIIGAVTASHPENLVGYNDAFLLLTAMTILSFFIAFALKNRKKERLDLAISTSTANTIN
jgi:EmrB/QacA subfamily drug resistance transporter